MEDFEDVEDVVTLSLRGEDVALHYNMATARWFQKFTKKSLLAGWNPGDPIEILTALYVGSLTSKPEWGNDGKPTKAGLDAFISEVEVEKSLKQWMALLPVVLKAMGLDKKKEEKEDSDEGKE